MAFSAAPQQKNLTPFSVEPAFLADEGGQSLFVPIIKGTFRIDGTSSLAVAEEQLPVDLAGTHWGHPDKSSYRFEPECVFVKPATDVVLNGHAYPSERGATHTLAGLRVGKLQKTVRVFGDRFWIKSLTGNAQMTEPTPFERMPLIYERAFGGWDRSDPDPSRHRCEPRNPVGVGFGARWSDSQEPPRVPNIEDPQELIRSWTDTPRPAGFGFLGPQWEPRAAFAGTYDERWFAQRMPLLPEDFDRRFFNGASPGLIAPGYLRGDEQVTVLNASPRGRLDFKLPGVAPPMVKVALRDGQNSELSTQLDTVVIDTDAHVVIMIWRAHLMVREVPRDVLAFTVESENVAPPFKLS